MKQKYRFHALMTSLLSVCVTWAILTDIVYLQFEHVLVITSHCLLLYVTTDLFVITDLCFNFNDGLVDPPFKLEHGWAITHCSFILV